MKVAENHLAEPSCCSVSPLTPILTTHFLMSRALTLLMLCFSDCNHHPTTYKRVSNVVYLGTSLHRCLRCLHNDYSRLLGSYKHFSVYC